jgi:DNA-binding MarR family transcriptional regulator
MSNDPHPQDGLMPQQRLGLAKGLMDTERELPLALRAAYLALHRKTDARFAEHGVTADQFVLLASLSRGEALTQRELAERISSDPSTVRAMLVLLEVNGLVQRGSHPTDARAKSVALTAAGKRIHKKLWRSGQPIRGELFASISVEEADTLVLLLRKIESSLNNDVVLA